MFPNEKTFVSKQTQNMQLSMPTTRQIFLVKKITNRFGRKNVIIISYIAIGLMGISLSIFTNVLILLIVIILLGIATFLSYPALFSFISEITNENIEGKMFGYIFTVQLAGGTIILFLSGVTSDLWGIWTPFTILGVLSFISAVLLFIKRKSILVKP